PPTTFMPRRDLVSADDTAFSLPRARYKMGAATVPAVSPGKSFGGRLKDEVPTMVVKAVFREVLGEIVGGPVGIPAPFEMYMDYLAGGRISIGAILSHIWDGLFGSDDTFQQSEEQYGL